MKKIAALLIAMTMVFALAACGDAGKTPSDNNVGDSIAWPSNHYTAMIPQPENTVIYIEEAIDNDVYIGHSILFEKWAIDDCRAYAAKLQAAGWTTPGDGMDAVIIKDTAEDFEFGAYNADHVFVSGSAHAANNSGGLSIYNLKQDLEEE